MCLVQRRIRCQPCRQVGVGDEWHTKRHGIRFATGQGRIGTGLVEPLVDDVRATECLFDQRPDAVVGLRSREQMKAMPRLPSARAT